jgi:hypothetical protein
MLLDAIEALEVIPPNEPDEDSSGDSDTGTGRKQNNRRRIWMRRRTLPVTTSGRDYAKRQKPRGRWGVMNICVCAVVSRVDSFMKYTLKLENCCLARAKRKTASLREVPCLMGPGPWRPPNPSLWAS